MKDLIFAIRKSLSARLSLCVVGFVAIFFMAALLVMFYYARTAVKKEALAKSEAALDGMIQRIDNRLRDVELATVNMHGYVENRVEDPEALQTISRKMLENNPSIVGCAIALDPSFCKDQNCRTLFCSYRGSDSILVSDHFGNRPYIEQEWYSWTYSTGEARWSDPTIENLRGGYPIMGYSIPIRNNGRVVGVFVSAISLEWLSHTIEEARPFPRTYCTLMNQGGAFVIHPDSSYLQTRTVYQQLDEYPDENLERLADAMLKGETGYMSVNIYGTPCYVFFKPYRNAGWAANIVSLKSDVFATYDRLQKRMFFIMVCGLLSLLVFCCYFIHIQFRPICLLDLSAQRLAAGHFDKPIADSYRKDEVGALQKSFRAMQRSLGRYLATIEQRKIVLSRQNEALRVAREKVREADRLKSVFVHNMTDQMIQPVIKIDTLVDTIYKNHMQLSHEEVVGIVDEMSEQTRMVTQLLDKTIEVSLNNNTEAQ
jgi:methyl-accepting chemotaxis protein/sigma-B regulation protein RsbU (phosphoserine phosphatase)